MNDTVAALKAYAPVFAEAGVKGYLEPLGFE
jgi:predicted xylose isomerase-like sugar epimerase